MTFHVEPEFSYLDDVDAPEVVVPEMSIEDEPGGGGGRTSFGCLQNFGGGGRGGDRGLA